MKVVALTTGRDVPSSRFRVRQHLLPLRQYGIEVREFFPEPSLHTRVPQTSMLRVRYMYPITCAMRFAHRFPGLREANRSDVIWLERHLIPGLPYCERLLRKPYILDIDDAIWLAKPLGAQSLRVSISRAAAVIAGNEYIAHWVEKFNRSVTIIPTAVAIPPCSSLSRSPGSEVTIGWIGTSSNFRYLDSIREPMAQVLRHHRDLRLKVVSDTPPPSFNQMPAGQYEYVRWSEAEEQRLVASFDIGVMPLLDDENARGKCSFKMLQYMASGVPSVVSPVGSNVGVLAAGGGAISADNSVEWYEALTSLAYDQDLRLRMGELGRLTIEKHFSIEKISPKIAVVFQSLGS